MMDSCMERLLGEIEGFDLRASDDNFFQDYVVYKFEEFLLGKGIYGMYMSNNPRFFEEKDGSMVLVYRADPEGWISEGFSWRETTEGDIFWYGVNSLWMLVLGDVLGGDR